MDDKLIRAIKWKKLVKKNWQSYKLVPPTKIELNPNMKNSYDKNFKKIKKHIAQANQDITLLWNCGTNQRELAFAKGIKKYSDKKLDAKILGFTEKSSRHNIINKMINKCKRRRPDARWFALSTSSRMCENGKPLADTI